MKKILIVLIALTTTLVSMTVLTDLYTRNQINKITDGVIISYRPFQSALELNNEKTSWIYIKDKNNQYVYSEKTNPIFLFKFLYNNIHAIDPTGEWYAGEDTPDEYKNGWRRLLAKNPTLAYKALDIYGETAIRQVNSKLKYKAKKNISESKQRGWEKFTIQKFWQEEENLIRRYQKLIDKLLKLSDKDLNYFINSNTSYEDDVSYDFQDWLERNNLVVTTTPPNWSMDEKSNEMYEYPGDLLLLTKRISEDYPEWTPRKFLTEAKKFSTKVLEIIEDNN
jgi:hypothetical protein